MSKITPNFTGDFEKEFEIQIKDYAKRIAHCQLWSDALRAAFKTDRRDYILLEWRRDIEGTATFEDEFKSALENVDINEIWNKDIAVRRLIEMSYSAQSQAVRVDAMKELNLVTGLVESRPYRKSSK